MWLLWEDFFKFKKLLSALGVLIFLAIFEPQRLCFQLNDHYFVYGGVYFLFPQDDNDVGDLGEEKWTFPGEDGDSLLMSQPINYGIVTHPQVCIFMTSLFTLFSFV